MIKKIKLIDSRIIEIVMILVLTISSYSLSSTILGNSVSLKYLVMVLFTRYILNLIIFNDFESSWSKATTSSYLYRTLIGLVAFSLYAPIVYATLLNPEYIINSLALELVVFISAQFILMRSYKFIVQMTETEVEEKHFVLGAGRPIIENYLK